MKRAKTLVIGASHWHAPLYADRIAAQHDVLGLSDADPASVENLAVLWNAPLYSSWEELLSRHQDAELAYVFVPHDTMRDVCLALIALRIPLVVEKPVGVSLQELTEVREAAEAGGVPVAIPLVQRGGPADSWLAKAGSSVYESAQFISGPPDRYLTNGSPWMVDPERAGGGCMINLAPHFVDLFLHSSGAERAAVTAALSSTLHGSDVEDYASLTLTTEEGRIAAIQVGYAFPGSPLKRHCSLHANRRGRDLDNMVRWKRIVHLDRWGYRSRTNQCGQRPLVRPVCGRGRRAAGPRLPQSARDPRS